MPRDILELPAPEADGRVAYGPGEYQFGELRVPAGAGPHAAIVYIHGGFWRARRGLEHAGHVCAALQSSGIATWNIEYRRAGNPGGGWPGTLEDVLAGTRYITEIARAHAIDVGRVAVAGHSAGGHLALWVAAQSHTPVRRAVSLGGVTDLRRAFELNLGDGAVREFLGAAPEEAAERYACSPIDLLPMAVPQLLIHGTRDDIVPVELSERFAARSGNCELFRVRGADHFDVIDPRSAYWPVVMGKLAEAVAGDW